MGSPLPAPPPGYPDAETVGRCSLRVGDRELPIDAMETLIGSSPQCQVIVNYGVHAAVYARMDLAGGRMHIEDLGSPLGTFVNGERIQGRVVVSPGDRIQVGVHEVEVIWRLEPEEADPASVLRRRSDPATPATTPPASVKLASIVRRGQSWSPPSRASVSSRGTRRDEEGDQGASVLRYIGHLADKMLAAGRIESARSLLEDPLRNILQKARVDRSVEADVVDTAGSYAVRLAAATLDGSWIDLAVEIHFIACRPMVEETLQRLVALRAKTPIGDEPSLIRYAHHLRENLEFMRPSDLARCERVAYLLLGADDAR